MTNYTILKLHFALISRDYCFYQLLILSCRYPDVLHRPHIPSTVYDRDQAVKACELAKQILAVVEENYLN